MDKPEIIFLVGPTASGKTQIAVYLAKRLCAEIISCDSMQIYKGMDILSAKPGAGLKKKIPHHLIGVVPVEKEYNVSRFRDQALKKAKALLKKNKLPLFVGGTGLYVSILLDGIFKSVPVNKRLRGRLLREAQRSGGKALYLKLKQCDPQAAARIHAHDTRRIIRALEVFRATGKPISQLQRSRRGLRGDYSVRIFCLDLPREELYRRIDCRVERMFRQGAVREVRGLLKKKIGRTASYAIGIRQIKGYLENSYGLEEAKELVKKNTRNFAKRQLTWFRKDKAIEWVRLRGDESPKNAAEKIIAAVNSKRKA